MDLPLPRIGIVLLICFDYRGEVTDYDLWAYPFQETI